MNAECFAPRRPAKNATSGGNAVPRAWKTGSGRLISTPPPPLSTSPRATFLSSGSGRITRPAWASRGKETSGSEGSLRWGWGGVGGKTRDTARFIDGVALGD